MMPKTRKDTPRTRVGRTQGHGGSVSRPTPYGCVGLGDTVTLPVGTPDSDEPVCHDCGASVEPNPAFAVLRCVRCAIRAGKETRRP